MVRQAHHVQIEGHPELVEGLDTVLWRPFLKDPTDEMVLETAVHGQAEKILTFNLKDFVGAEQFGVRVDTPDTAWKEWGKKL